ncbi:SH3 domain-containing kinase-binding protein 1-like [Ptychodera flava]|uniref:SH3 domain-containing kinase-binding protein 1-like n=1 Tax=Ptychodera flava TaxID=63121 RepID=UPI00396A5E1C
MKGQFNTGSPSEGAVIARFFDGVEQGVDSSLLCMKRAKVLFPYTPQNPDELRLNKGDIVTVLSQDGGDHGLWKGKLNGKAGVFPYNFVKLIEDKPETHRVHIQNPAKPKNRPPLPPKPKQPPVKRAKVLFPYTPLNQDELRLTKGDIVTVLSQDGGEHGLWKGKLNGKVGVFPYNIVKLIEDEPESHRVHIQNPGKPNKRPSPPPKPKPAPVKRAKVLFPYTPQNPDELGLNKGDIVTVLSQDRGKHGMWKGKLNGKVGVFPYNIVKLIEDEPETHPVYFQNPDKPNSHHLHHHHKNLNQPQKPSVKDVKRSIKIVCPLYILKNLLPKEHA